MASAAAVIFLVFAFAASATAASPAAPPVKTVQVDVIGDSLSTGYRTPGDTWPGQAQKIVAGMGLNAHITNASENGAGYVQPGQDGDVFLDLVNRIVNSHAQVVVLFGSDNDAGRSGEVTAVQAALARVKALAPHAAVILVGPTSESDDPTGSLAGIRQTLATAASGIGATFVDPISLGWFQGSASADLSADLEHPNTAGELYLAQHMTAVMAPALKTAMQRNEARAGWPVRVRLTDAVRAV
jgi:acyl-CoA thioesterase I